MRGFINDNFIYSCDSLNRKRTINQIMMAGIILIAVINNKAKKEIHIILSTIRLSVNNTKIKKRRRKKLCINIYVN